LQTCTAKFSRRKISRAVASAIRVSQQRVAARCEPSAAAICLGCCSELLWHADKHLLALWIILFAKPKR